MRLASDDLIITINGEAFTLRPSLRAALRLSRRHETFAALALAISQGTVSTIAEIIRECAIDPSAESKLLAALECTPMVILLESLRGPFVALVLALASADEGASQGEATGKPVPFVDHFEHLFEIATGFLGWTPEQAWSATPAEILAAHEGRIKLLKMIFGGNDAETKRATLSLDEKARFAFSSIGIRKAA